MKQQTTIVYIALLLALSFSDGCNQAGAARYETIYTFSNTWKFSLGDDSTWSMAEVDDSKWDDISAPSAWENEGYIGYDGIAWYRQKFKLPQSVRDLNLFLSIGAIDDCDEIYINGHLIGFLGNFDPDEETPYNWKRFYQIPGEFLNFNSDNTIAIRVFDAKQDGGIIKDRVKIIYNPDEEYLLIPLNHNWKLKLNDSDEFKKLSFDDSGWSNIKVPQNWESQGYWDYDGYAWYRNTLEIENDFKIEDLYISLGRIDDYSIVYINGEIVGKEWPIRIFKVNKYTNDDSYRKLRIYKIPNGLLKKGKNVIAVRVYDRGFEGGIYEGPVGILKKSNANELRNSSYDRIINEGTTANLVGNFEIKPV